MKVAVEISDDDARLILDLLNSLGDKQFSSHGELDVPTLTRMLLEDVALVRRRPGSWEGSNMAQVLSSHGYET